MQIAMIGTGYVGLVSGTCFSEFGTDVVCVDVDKSKIDRLNNGEIPIFEPGLDKLVAGNRKAERLSFTTDMASAVSKAEAVFLAVGTPTSDDQRSADLSILFEAARQLAPSLKGYTVVVTKSTVPVGTGRRVEQIIRETNPAADFDMVSNPEFLREGAAINDFMRPDRVVIGAESPRAVKVMRALYRPLYLIETPIVFTSLETAEIIKYAANAFLAVKITFINEIADLCEKAGADVHHVAKGIGLDGRIGKKFLHPGPGYGGSCFPKDTRALSHSAHDLGSPLKIVDTVMEVNEARKTAMAQRVIDHFGGSLAGKKVAVLGVTFKPNTDDMREAPSLSIIPVMQAAGAKVSAYDPEGMEHAKKMLDDVEWCETAYDTVADSDVLVIITEWNEFRALDIPRVKGLMRQPVMFDLRNIYNANEMLAMGIEYLSVGRPKPVGMIGK